jgi:hypothetical protein
LISEKFFLSDAAEYTWGNERRLKVPLSHRWHKFMNGL